MEKKSVSTSRDKKRLFQKLNSQEKTLAVVILAAMLVGAWLPGRIIVATSPSLNHRIFFMSSVNIQKVKTGDYLVFRHADTPFVHKGLNKENDRLIKKVGCCPGEVLSRDTDSQFFCAGTFLGKALTENSKGRLLPQFHFTGRVPDNSFFMVGANPRSFDSKYFGFVHADEILYKALPLW